jgi:putative ABC transport system permease protein
MQLGFDELPLHGVEFHFIQSHSRASEFVAAFKSDQFNLNGDTDSERIDGIRASADFFKVLGIQPQWGRPFVADEDQAGREHEVVISQSLWRRRFASDPSLIGEIIRLNSEPYSVIGIMPDGFAFPRGAEMPKSMSFPKLPELWVPLALPAEPHGPSDLAIIARLRAGISQEQVKADLARVSRELIEQDARWKNWANYKVIPLRTQIEGEAQQRLLLLAAAVLLVLLITCANVSNLLLARSLGRAKDFAVRAALGAKRHDLIRIVLTESVLLAFLGTGLGLLISWVILQVVKSSFSQYIPRLQDAHLDATVTAFATIAAFVVGAFFGIFPGVYMSGSPLIDHLRSREGKISGTRVSRIRGTLVAGQIGLSLMLVIGAGLLLRSFVNMLKTDPGFQASHLASMEVTLPVARYANAEAAAALHRRIIDCLLSVPGVQSTALVKPMPMGGTQEETVFTIPGRIELDTNKPNELPIASYTIVSPDYFKTTSVPLIRGRAFNEADDAKSPWVVIISEAMARQFWPGEDPLGRVVKLPASWYPAMTIVGVAGDVKKFSLADSPGPEMYVPYKQKPYPSMLSMSFVLRTNRNVMSLTNELQKAVMSVDAELPVANVESMAELVSRSMSPQKLSASILGAFSVAALALAVIGIYGVVAFIVNERTHEIGIRIALGAQRTDVFRLVFGQGVPLLLGGLVAGFAASLGLSRLLTSFIFGIKAWDPITFVVSSLALAAAASAAIYIPARQATRVDPMDTLRAE